MLSGPCTHTLIRAIPSFRESAGYVCVSEETPLDAVFPLFLFIGQKCFKIRILCKRIRKFVVSIGNIRSII